MRSPKPWKLLASRYLHYDRWLKVRTNTFEKTSNGQTIDPYYTLEYPHWVNVFAITSDQHLVVNRQYRPALDRICLELPSGWVDDGERPEECAFRELLEETGYQARTMELTGILSPNPATHINYNYCFLARDVELVGKPKLELEEDIVNSLIPLEEIEKMALEGEFVQALHVSAIFFALHKLRE
jgi:8-oxo-dGTP pyrophosphatase MutT (NUDIX family)